MKMHKFFVIGLDGSTFRIIDPLMDSGKLPNLRRLKAEGSSGILRSTIHPYSAQAWSSFMTGMNPGKHGIYDFVHHEDGNYRLRFVNAADRKAHSIWKILSHHGLNVGVVNVPLTYPPEEVNGFLIAGMDSPGKASNFTYPRSILEELETRVGPYTIELNVRDYMRHGLEEQFLDDLKQMIRRQVRAVKNLMSTKEWDFFTFVSRAPDQVQHFYWRFMDPAHPYRPKEVPSKLQNAIADVYGQLDAAIGEIEGMLGPDTYLLIISDHGQGPDGNRAFYINKWLRSVGYLSFKNENRNRALRRICGQETVSRSVDFLKGILPRKLKDSLLNRFPWLRDRVETALSFSDIDFTNTLAYSEDVRGNIWINLKGRQREGMVDPGEYERVREEIIRLLKELRDPQTGEHLVDRVFRREDLYHGEFLSGAPDIIFTQPADAYKHMLRRSRTDRDSMSSYIETLPESEIEIWPTSSHTLDGIFLLRGTGVNRGTWIDGARIIDVAPTILYLMGLPIPSDMDGSVIRGAIDPMLLEDRPPEKMPFRDAESLRRPYTKGEEAIIGERLRNLGYLE